MAEVDTRTHAPSSGPVGNDNREEWIGDHQKKDYEEKCGVTEQDFLRFYGAKAANTRAADPKEGILFNDAADEVDTRTLKLRFFAWLAEKKWKKEDRDAAVDLLTQEITQFQKDHENDVHAQVPAPVIDEVLNFVRANGKLTHNYYRYDEKNGIWQLVDGPVLEADTDMGENFPDGHSATDQETIFEGRPDFVRDICEEHDATSLMNEVLRNPKDAKIAEKFLIAVNPDVMDQSISEGLDDKAYLLNMSLIRQAMMVCTGNELLLQGMKELRLNTLDGKDASMYETQCREFRKGFAYEIGSKGYPLEWSAMFDKTVREITSQHEDKTQPLYTMEDVAAAAGGHKPLPSTVSVYNYVKKAFEEAKAKESNGAKPSEESAVAAMPESGGSSSEVESSVARVEYLGENRPIGAVRVVNWNKCATARENKLECNPKHEILVQMNEADTAGKSVLPYWDIVKADHLEFDVGTYGEENISVEPGQEKNLTTRILANFHVEGIAVAPKVGGSSMPHMLILGRCEEDGKSHLFTRSTLSRRFGEGPVVKKILAVMAKNGMTPPKVPDGASDRTRQIWTGKKTKINAKPNASKTVPAPGSGNGKSVLNDTDDDDDGYILSNKSRTQSHEGGKKGSIQSKDDSDLKVEVASLAKEMKSLKAMLVEALKQSSQGKED